MRLKRFCSSRLLVDFNERPFRHGGFVDRLVRRISGRTVLSTIRNILVHKYLKPTHDFVLWMDADVVNYPADLIVQLYEV